LLYLLDIGVAQLDILTDSDAVVVETLVLEDSPGLGALVVRGDLAGGKKGLALLSLGDVLFDLLQPSTLVGSVGSLLVVGRLLATGSLLL
jgi:hypothetical protein